MEQMGHPGLFCLFLISSNLKYLKNMKRSSSNWYRDSNSRSSLNHKTSDQSYKASTRVNYDSKSHKYKWFTSNYDSTAVIYSGKCLWDWPQGSLKKAT